LPDDLYRKLKARANRQRRSVAEEVAQILNDVLASRKALSILELKGLGKEHWRDIDAATHGKRNEDSSRTSCPVEELDEGKRELVTSALTLLEVLVVPYRVGNTPLAERYELLLTRSRGIRMTELSRDQLRAAA
jgi:plasmid stability protein